MVPERQTLWPFDSVITQLERNLMMMMRPSSILGTKELWRINQNCTFMEFSSNVIIMLWRQPLLYRQCFHRFCPSLHLRKWLYFYVMGSWQPEKAQSTWTITLALISMELLPFFQWEFRQKDISKVSARSLLLAEFDHAGALRCSWTSLCLIVRLATEFKN